LHLHTCVHIFSTVFTLLSPFPATSPPLVPPSLGSVLPSCSLIFVEEKKITLLLVWDKGSYTGSFLRYFHVYMYYNTNWFMSS
jgi:hypothetical protein